MDTFVFEGTFTYMVQAASLEEAQETMQDEMDSVLMDYRVERTYS